MSAADDRYSGAPDEDEDHGELSRLNALHDDLVEAVQTAINPTVRADLAAELRSVRERIAELSIADGGARRAPEPGRTVHSYEVPVADSNGVGSGFAADASVASYGDDRYPAGSGSVDGDGYDDAPRYGYQQAEYPSNDNYVDDGAGAYQAAPRYSSDPMWERSTAARSEAPPQATVGNWTEARPGFWSARPWLPLVLAILGGLVLAAIVGFGGVFRGADEDEAATVASDEAAQDPAGASSATAIVADIRSMLDGMGYANVGVDELNGSVALSGSVPSDADRQAVIGAASALAGSLPFDSSGLVVTGGEAAPTEVTAGPGDPASVMQRELERILAGTPIRFDQGQVAVTERHQAILNNVVGTMAAYPEQSVVVVGYTDDQGTPEANEQLSAARAQNVKDYLVSQGVSADRLEIRAVGEAQATGAAGLANLERRVEFEVVGAAGGGGEGLRVGVVTPSASNDLAFSQSMVDALNLLAQERGIEVSVTDGTFVESDAAAALRGYAEQDYDLVVAHGSQFGASVQELATQFPDVAFAWGTASDTFGLPNVYAYDARAQEGGYVLGAMAALVSPNSNIGVVGPIEVGDAALYINGFEQGATAERPGTTVQVDYIESFSDIALAAEAATAHLDGGADVLTGSAQMVVGAVDVAATRGALWFGTQADQASLAPELVVASQVYRWEVILRPILDDVVAGRLAGTGNSLTLANQGLVIAFNDGYALDPEVRRRADQLVFDISSGAIVPAG